MFSKSKEISFPPKEPEKRFIQMNPEFIQSISLSQDNTEIQIVLQENDRTITINATQFTANITYDRKDYLYGITTADVSHYFRNLDTLTYAYTTIPGIRYAPPDDAAFDD